MKNSLAIGCDHRGLVLKHKIASYCDMKKTSLKSRRRLLKRKGSIMKKLAKCSKRERQILMQ